MLHLMESLPAGSRILDLGAGGGSFPGAKPGLCLVRLDLQAPAAGCSGSYVRADAARMPFAPASFDLIISNHSLEHFCHLEETVREIGRVMKPGGALYVAVPDATTLTDRIYRWMGRGGGHLNPFRTPDEVVGLIERLTGLPHRATRELYSSLSFLNAHNFVGRPQKKAILFACGNERFLAVFTWILRWWDQRFGTRLSRYGWSFYFGGWGEPESPEPWVNVCVRCGSGHPEALLRKVGGIQKAVGVFQTYRCPTCGGFNLLF